jgi:hypothetical protein
MWMGKVSGRQQAYRCKLWLSICAWFLLCGVLLLANIEPAMAGMARQDGSQAAGPAIHDIQWNVADYPDGLVPRFEKLEITFQVDTQAKNLQLPYDPAPPPGLAPGMGISVDALFTPDNWQTVYTQPAFYYQEFDDQVKAGSEWFYPTGGYSWKVRFAPDRVGAWQFKLVAQDASGKLESQTQSFGVVLSDRKGFIRVSRRDARYFEFEDGAYFPGLGYNMNYNHVDWGNPLLGNQENFQQMSQVGIQLVRIWLSEWGIYGSAWNPWNSIAPEQHGQYIPETGLTSQDAYPGSDFSMALWSSYNPCMFLGAWKTPPAVKENTLYRVRVRYKTVGIQGPRLAGQPYGLVAKTGGWLWGQGNNCNDPGTGTLVTPHQSGDADGWGILEGSLQTGDQDFLPYFYLALENVSGGTAYVDYVWIEEDLGEGNFGPNIVSKPWMAQHLYMEQRNSYAFDKVVALAHRYGIYLRPVISEKNEFILNRLDDRGNPIAEDPKCWDEDTNNDPAECPGNDWFYGDGRTATKTRWLQQAWWRYLQARWGYSTNIHSWELLNEGDPWNQRHYVLADEFGRYMHQFDPDDHLVSTSFWHSFPRDAFWSNPDYAHVDFADVHQYVEQGSPGFSDTALATYDVSLQYGALRPGGAGKPVIRGETGFQSAGYSPTNSFAADNKGVWLHNFVWGQINAGGLLESYWYENVHIYQRNSDGTYVFDLRPIYKTFYNFIATIPLNNGHYEAIQTAALDENLRVWGQIDQQTSQAYAWIQNKQHTWSNVVNQAAPAGSYPVSLERFVPGWPYEVQWWDTYQPDPSRQVLRSESVHAQPDGSLRLMVQDLSTDVAVKIRPNWTASTWFYFPLLLSGK